MSAEPEPVDDELQAALTELLGNLVKGVEVVGERQDRIHECLSIMADMSPMDVLGIACVGAEFICRKEGQLVREKIAKSLERAVFGDMPASADIAKEACAMANQMRGKKS